MMYHRPLGPSKKLCELNNSEVQRCTIPQDLPSLLYGNINNMIVGLVFILVLQYYNYFKCFT